MSLTVQEGQQDARRHVEAHLRNWSTGRYLFSLPQQKSKPTKYQSAHAKELLRLAKLMAEAIS